MWGKKHAKNQPWNSQVGPFLMNVFNVNVNLWCSYKLNKNVFFQALSEISPPPPPPPSPHSGNLVLFFRPTKTSFCTYYEKKYWWFWWKCPKENVVFPNAVNNNVNQFPTFRVLSALLASLCNASLPEGEQIWRKCLKVFEMFEEEQI